MSVKLPFLNKPILPLMLMLLGNAIAHSLFVIGFPILGRTIGINEIYTGAILSLSAICMTVASPVWGRIIDKRGRKIAIMTGILGTAVFLILCAALIYIHSFISLTVTTLIITFFILRIGQSIAVAGLMPGAQAYIADVTSFQRRLSGMGSIGAMFGFGSIIGGYITMMSGVNYFTVVLLILGICMLCTSYAHHFLHPDHTTARRSDNSSHASHILEPLKIRTILPFVLITFCVLSIYGCLQQTTGLRLQDQLGWTAQEALKGGGGLLTASMLTMATGQVILSFTTSDKPEKLMKIGLPIGIASMIGLALATTYIEMLVAMFFLGGAMSLVMPANLTLLSHTAGPMHQAYAASINIIGKGLGWAAGPLVGSILYQYDTTLPVWVSVGLFITALMIILFYPERFIHRQSILKTS